MGLVPREEFNYDNLSYIQKINLYVKGVLKSTILPSPDIKILSKTNDMGTWLGIPITKQVYIFPQFNDGRKYIVPEKVAAACRDRWDLLIQGPAIKDEDDQTCKKMGYY